MKRRIVNFRNILFLIGISSELALYASLLAYMFANLDGLKAIDYLVIYSGGYIFHYEAPSRLYDVDLQRTVQMDVLSVDEMQRFYPYNHPPTLAPVLGWVTTDNYTASYFRWALVLIIFHLIALAILLRLMRAFQWPASELWILGISGLLFFPVFVSFLKGQDSAFLLLGVSLWAFAVLTNKDKLAGLSLALVAIRPQIALVLAIPFLFKRRTVWWWFIIGGLILLSYSYLLIGWQGLVDYIQVLLLGGQGLGFDVDVMITLVGAVVRIYPAIPASALNMIRYTGYALAILFLCAVWMRTRTIEFKHIGLAIVLSMIFSPHMHSHDWSLLLIVVFGAAIVLAEQKILSRRNSALLPLGFSVLLMLFNGIIQSNFMIYVLILGSGMLLWVPGWIKASRKKSLA